MLGQGMNEVRIELASNSDLAGVVEVHRRAFPGSLMTELGPWFLTDYYGLALREGGGLFVVARSPLGRVNGFAVGYLVPQDFYRKMVVQKMRLAFSALRYLIWRPLRWAAVISAYRRANRNAESFAGKTAELASLAVDRGCAGRGVGGHLVRRFVSMAKEAGVAHVVLTTEANDNDNVIRFYRSHGFGVSRQFIYAQGREMYEMELNLKDRVDADIYAKE